MSRRIVLFGATGYTGRLVAQALVAARARPVLAGRSQQSLAALGVQLGHGLDTAVADVTDPDSLLELVRPGDVLVSTVGPFTRYGLPVLQAAIARGATYLDSTGEPPFLRAVFEEHSEAATAASVALIPAMAYEYLGGHLAATLALEAAGERATRIDIGYFVLGKLRTAMSVGTRASAGAVALMPHFAWRDGELVACPAADRSRRFMVNGESRLALAVGGEEHLTLPRTHPGLRDVGVFVGVPAGERLARMLGGFSSRGARVPGLPETVRWLAALPRNQEGPDADQRTRTRSAVIAVASDAEGNELSSFHVGAANPYTFTGAIMAWAAMRIAAAGVEGSGALSPVEAFGLGRLRDACATAGLPASEV